MPISMLLKAEGQAQMSAPDFLLRLSKPAQRDFRDILSYTLQTWGDRQCLEYRRKIDTALQAIAAHPYTGHHQHEFMVYPVGRHSIYYRVQANVIYVIRILHCRMDAPRHLPEQ